MSNLTKAQIKFFVYFFVCTCVLILSAILIKMFKASKIPLPVIATQVTTALQNKIDTANETMLQEKAKATLDAAVAKSKLEEIGKIDDGAARRAALAKLLNQ